MDLNWKTEWWKSPRLNRLKEKKMIRKKKTSGTIQEINDTIPFKITSKINFAVHLKLTL